MNNGKTCSRGVGHVVIDVLQTDCIVRCYSSDHPNPDGPETRKKKHFTCISPKVIVQETNKYVSTYANQDRLTKLMIQLRAPTTTSKTLTIKAGRSKIFFVFIIPKTTAP